MGTTLGGVVFRARVGTHQRTQQMSHLASGLAVCGVKVKQLLLVGQVFITNSRAKFY